MEVSIVIVNYNGKKLLEKCLNSITKTISKDDKKSKNHEIIVVDNNSTDGSIEFLNKNYKDIRVIRNKKKPRIYWHQFCFAALQGRIHTFSQQRHYYR